MNILDLYREITGHTPKKKTAMEYAGPCPECGGDDRFCLMLNQGKDGQGRYFCRGCERTGDRIQFLRDFCGLSFMDACKRLGVETDLTTSRPRRQANVPSQTPSASQAWTPKANQTPGPAWQDKAHKLVEWASDQLSNNNAVMGWLKTERGLEPATVHKARLGWIPTDTYRERKTWGLPEELNTSGKPKRIWIPAGLSIPVFDSNGSIQRIKFRRPEGEPKYIPIPTAPTNTAPMMLQSEAMPWTVVESELDALLLHQAAGHLVNVLALGSASYPPDAMALPLLTSAPFILLCLDYDEAGQKRTYQWWTEHFPTARPWPVPEGKDICDAWKRGWSLADWISQALPVAMREKPKRDTPAPRQPTAHQIPARQPSFSPLPDTVITEMAKAPHLAPCPLRRWQWVYRDQACPGCGTKRECPAWTQFTHPASNNTRQPSDNTDSTAK